MYQTFEMLVCLLACLLVCLIVRAQRIGARPLRGRGNAAGAARRPIRMQYLFFCCGWIPPGIYSVRLQEQLRFLCLVARFFAGFWPIVGSHFECLLGTLDNIRVPVHVCFYLFFLRLSGLNMDAQGSKTRFWQQTDCQS